MISMVSIYIREWCSSDATTKVYRDCLETFKRFFRMCKASDNTKAVMKKQTRQIHSVFSNVGP